jgi:hypothetical protein
MQEWVLGIGEDRDLKMRIRRFKKGRQWKLDLEFILHIHSSSVGHENFAEVNLVLGGFACTERYKSSTSCLLKEASGQPLEILQLYKFVQRSFSTVEELLLWHTQVCREKLLNS